MFCYKVKVIYNLKLLSRFSNNIVYNRDISLKRNKLYSIIFHLDNIVYAYIIKPTSFNSLLISIYFIVLALLFYLNAKQFKIII